MAKKTKIPKKPVEGKKRVNAPTSYNPGKGRPQEFLAYLNKEEMAALRRMNGNNMERGPKGLPSFPPDDAIGSGQDTGNTGTTTGTTTTTTTTTTGSGTDTSWQGGDGGDTGSISSGTNNASFGDGGDSGSINSGTVSGASSGPVGGVVSASNAAAPGFNGITSANGGISQLDAGSGAEGAFAQKESELRGGISGIGDGRITSGNIVSTTAPGYAGYTAPEYDSVNATVGVLRDTIDSQLGYGKQPLTSNINDVIRHAAGEVGIGAPGYGQVVNTMINRTLVNREDGPQYANSFNAPNQWTSESTPAFKAASPGSALAGQVAYDAVTELANGVPAPNATDFRATYQTKKLGTQVGGNTFGNYEGVSGEVMADIRAARGLPTSKPATMDASNPYNNAPVGFMSTPGGVASLNRTVTETTQPLGVFGEEPDNTFNTDVADEAVPGFTQTPATLYSQPPLVTNPNETIVNKTPYPVAGSTVVPDVNISERMAQAQAQFDAAMNRFKGTIGPTQDEDRAVETVQRAEGVNTLIGTPLSTERVIATEVVPEEGASAPLEINIPGGDLPTGETAGGNTVVAKNQFTSPKVFTDNRLISVNGQTFDLSETPEELRNAITQHPDYASYANPAVYTGEDGTTDYVDPAMAAGTPAEFGGIAGLDDDSVETSPYSVTPSQAGIVGLTGDEATKAAIKAGFRPNVAYSDAFRDDYNQLGMMPGEVDFDSMSPEERATAMAKLHNRAMAQRYDDIKPYYTPEENERRIATNLTEKAVVRLAPGPMEPFVAGGKKLMGVESANDFLGRPKYEQDQLYKYADEANARYGRSPLQGDREGGGDGSSGLGEADMRVLRESQWAQGINVPNKGDPDWQAYRLWLNNRRNESNDDWGWGEGSDSSWGWG